MGYIDPNLFGILSQVGLAILLVVGVVLTFFRSLVKNTFGKLIGLFKPNHSDYEDVNTNEEVE